MKPKILLGLAISLLICCRPTTTEPMVIPLSRLIAEPEKYHGAHVQVIGFVHFEFESNVIYPHKEDYEHAIIPNGVWLDLPAKVKTNLDGLDMKYCIVGGRFSAIDKGHLGMWSGSIQHIIRFQVWSDPANPKRRQLKEDARL